MLAHGRAPAAATRPHRQHRATRLAWPCPARSALSGSMPLWGPQRLYRRFLFLPCIYIFPCLCSPFSCLQYVDKRNGKRLTFKSKMPRSTYSIQLLCLRCCLSRFECTPHVDMVRQIEQIVFWYSAYIKIHISPSPLHQAGNAIRYFISIWLYWYLYSIFCIDMVVSILNGVFIEQFSLPKADRFYHIKPLYQSKVKYSKNSICSFVRFYCYCLLSYYVYRLILYLKLQHFTSVK